MKDQPLEFTITYTSEKLSQKPYKLLILILSDIMASRELAWRLFLRDISAQYRQSLLGIFWAFFPPIITAAIFILLQSRNIISTTTNIPYPAYVLIGTTLWQIFADSVNAPLKSTTGAKPYLVKIYFPREALLISSFLGVLFNVLIRMIIVLGVFIYFKIPLHGGLLLAPIGIFLLILLGMVIGILITPIGMLYSDVSTSLPIILQLLFFATPVVYTLPEKFPFSILNIVNPVTPLLVNARNLMINGVFDNTSHFIFISTITIISAFISLAVFRKSLPIIIEKLGT